MRAFFLKSRGFCASLLGLVFFLSGFFKLMDFVGTGLIVEEYFKFLHIGFLIPISRPLAFILSLSESLLGAALMCGLWRKWTRLVALVIISVFTILTFFLWIKNPPMDCGCFGEVIHLTHVQSLVKNLILLVLALASFLPCRDYGVPKGVRYVSFSIVTLLMVYFGIYNVLELPLMDFTPFKPTSQLLSSALAEETEVDESMAPLFIYEKDGIYDSFSIEDLPDSTWTFVETVSNVDDVLGDNPDLPVNSLSGESCSELAAEGRVLVMSFYSPDRAGSRKWRKAAEFVQNARSNGFRPLVLVAAAPLELRGMLAGEPQFSGIEGSIYSSDYKALISMNRSNGGVTMFDEGMLLRKWSCNGVPDGEELSELASEDSTDIVAGYETAGRIAVQLFLLFVLAVIILLR